MGAELAVVTLGADGCGDPRRLRGRAAGARGRDRLDARCRRRVHGHAGRRARARGWDPRRAGEALGAGARRRRRGLRRAGARSTERRAEDARVPGGATRSSTRSTRARFRTPTATGSATCAAIARASTTSSGSASTRSGSRRSTPRRSPTPATTSPTTRRSTPSTARSPTSTRWSARCHDARDAGAARPGRLAHLDRAPVVSRAPRLVRLGRRRARRTTGARPSAARPGAATSAAGAGTCTPSIPSSPTSTGATPRSAAAIGDGDRLLARARRRRLSRRRGRSS